MENISKAMVKVLNFRTLQKKLSSNTFKIQSDYPKENLTFQAQESTER